jgi:hypothetical protein
VFLRRLGCFEAKRTIHPTEGSPNNCSDLALGVVEVVYTAIAPRAPTYASSPETSPISDRNRSVCMVCSTSTAVGASRVLKNAWAPGVVGWV